MKNYLNNLPISHKLLISSLTYILPLSILFYFVTSDFNDTIRFARRELMGSEVSKPLAKLTELVPEHRRYIHFSVSGDMTQQNNRELTAQEIDAAFSELLAKSGKYEKALQIDRQSLSKIDMGQYYPAELFARWQSLQANWKAMSPEQSETAHSELSKGITTLTSRVANTSNLVRDPDMDTYHLIYNVFVGIPQIQERCSEMLLNGRKALESGRLTQEDRIAFAEFIDITENYYMRFIRQNLSFALQEDEHFYGKSQSMQKNLPPVFDNYDSAVSGFISLLKRLVSDERLPDTVDEFTNLGEKMLDTSSAFNQVAIHELDVLLEKRIATNERSRLLAYLLIIIALSVSWGIAFLISRGITRPLGVITRVAESIAAGNLKEAKTSLESAYRLGFGSGQNSDRPTGTNRNEVTVLFQAITTMISDLDAIITRLRTASDKVTESKSRIVTSMRQLEAIAAEQAASTTQVRSTSTHICSNVKDLASTMNRVTEMSVESAALANSGIQGLENIRTTMRTLLDASSDTNDKLKMISEKAATITEVITTITNVADQTNLLSLNASIEAVKAGEYGAGFSVVASEIRRLADQTAVAALNIEAMILEMENAMKDGVASVDNYHTLAKESSEKTARISMELGTIIEHSREFVPQFESLNQGMQSQSDSASQISDAMQQLNITAIQVRDSLIEFKEVTDQLTEAVENLQEVSRFS